MGCTEFFVRLFAQNLVLDALRQHFFVYTKQRGWKDLLWKLSCVNLLQTYSVYPLDLRWTQQPLAVGLTFTPLQGVLSRHIRHTCRCGPKRPCLPRWLQLSHTAFLRRITQQPARRRWRGSNAATKSTTSNNRNQ